MKRAVAVNCEAVLLGLRKAYWCIEASERSLKSYAEGLGLAVCAKPPRVVFDPSVVSDATVSAAFDDAGVAAGELLGYPSPGEAFSRWWVSWQVSDHDDVMEFTTLFNFQMERLDTRKLVRMKERWNAAFDGRQYIDFQIRYRANRNYADRK